MAINTLPVQFERNYKGAPFIGTLFTTTAALNSWLTSPTRYAGQGATLVEAGVVSQYVLDAAETAWEAAGGGGAGGLTIWVTATAYVIDDQIYDPLTHKLYICTTGHTSSVAFNTDIANWTELSSGGFPKWITATNYIIDDQVYDPTSNSLFVCTTGHTASAAFATDIANWTEVNANVRFFKWITAIVYAIDDFIWEPTSNKTYVCTTGHTASAAFVTDIANWQEVSTNVRFFKWITAIVYAIDDFIWEPTSNKTYVCTTGHTASAAFATDVANWQEVSTNVRFFKWVTANVYVIDDFIWDSTSGKIYVCTTGHTASAAFITDIANWTELSKSLDKWITATVYATDDLIYDPTSSKIYVCTTGHTASAAFVTDIANWQELSEGSVSASDILVSSLGITTKDNVQSIINLNNSTGVYSGGEFTSNNDGTMSVALGEAAIRSVDSNTAELFYIEFPVSVPADIVLTDGEFHYVYLEYNAGTPKIITTLIERTDINTNVLLGYTYRSGNSLHFTTSVRTDLSNFAAKLINRLGRLEAFVRESGAALSEVGTRGVSCTQGIFWIGLNEVATVSTDTTDAFTSNNSFEYLYFDGASWLRKDAITSAVAFTGVGLNDGTSSGAFSGSHTLGITAEIDSVGGTDTFKYSHFDNDGVTVLTTSNIPITGAAQHLIDNVNITFTATTGHTLGDKWKIDAYLSQQIDNAQYNDTTTGLVALSNKTYGIHWVYIDIHGHVAILYGDAEYSSLDDAKLATALTSIPAEFKGHNRLVGKIIVKEGDVNLSSVRNIYDDGINISGEAASHLDLTDIGTKTHAEIETDLISNTSTGIFTGGDVSIGAPTSTFTITDGNGRIVDNHTDANIPTVEEVSWTGLTNIAVTNIATQPATYIGVQTGGAVVQQATPFTSSQHRDIIAIGLLIHTDNVAIDSVSSDPHFVGSAFNQVIDMAHAIGVINVDGNTFAANGANLNIDKSSGTMFSLGSNFQTSAKDPNNISTPSLDSTIETFLKAWRDGAGGGTFSASVNVIDPTVYDTNTGTPTAMSNNKWQILRMFFDPQTENTIVVHGQNEYDSMAGAEAAISGATFDLIPELVQVPLRGWLLVKKESTTLNDNVTAKFIEADKFGTAGAGGATSSTTTLQKAYENSPNPEIELNATNGVFTVRDNVAPLGTNLTEVTNNAETVKYHEVSAERTQITDNDGTFTLREDLQFRHIEDFKHVLASAYFTPSANCTAGSETTTPLSGTTSAKLTQVGAALGNNWVGSSLDVNKPEFKVKEISLEWIANFNGSTGDCFVKLEWYNGTVWATIEDVDLINGDGVYTKVFNLASDAEDVRVSPEILNPDNADIIIIDKIKINMDPLKTAESVIVENASFQQYVAYSSSNTAVPYFTTEKKNTISKLGSMSNSSTTGMRFTALVECEVTVTFSHASTTGSYFGITKNSSELSTSVNTLTNDSVVESFSYGATTSAGDNVSWTGILAPGDFICPHTDKGAVNTNVQRTHFNITASSTSANVVFEGETSELDWTPYTPTITGLGTVTNVDVYSRRQNDTLHVHGFVSCGTPTATAVKITLPTGLNIDTAKTISDRTIIGRYNPVNGGSADIKTDSGVIYYLSSGTDEVLISKNAATDTSFASINGSSVFNASDGFSFSFSVAIDGWKASDVLISVPVTNEVENTYSARIANNGTATVTSQSANAFSSPNWDSTGKVTVSIASLGLTLPPSATLTVEDATPGRIATIDSISATSITIETTHDAGAVVDLDFNITIQRQGADYIHPKGYFLGNFSQPVGYLKDVKTSGTAGGTFTSGAWRDRDLNTDSGAFSSFGSLASNIITLTPGKYEFDITVPGYNVDNHKSKLVSDPAGTPIDVLIGSTENATAGHFTQTVSRIVGEVIIATDTDFGVQHRCSSTLATNGFGAPASYGVDEVYTQVKIRKLKLWKT